MRLWAISIVLLGAGLALAVTPATWDNTSESDFAKGKFESTAVVSLGEIRLAREIEILMPADSAPAVVSAVVYAADAVYAASGTEAVIYKIADDEAASFAELPGTMIASLIQANDKLLAGVGGDEAGIYAIDSDGDSEKLWADPNVKYVWAIVPVGEHTLYAATGPEGKVLAIDTSGDEPTTEVLFEAGKLAKNILCLTRSTDGLLYAGTDTDGLVVEIDPDEKTSRVILDAAEKSIAAILVDQAGRVYAATSDAAKAGANGKVQRNHVKAGKATTTSATKPSPQSMPAETSPDAKSEGADAEDESDSPEPNDDQTKAADDSPADESPHSRFMFENSKAAPAEAEGGKEKIGDMLAELAAAVPSPESTQERPPVVEMVRRVMNIPPGMSKPPTSRPPAKGRGNAVYLIRQDGLVETRFRRPVTILSMLLRDGRLYLGTGNGGAIYSVSEDGDEIVQLADTDAKQVTAMQFGAGGEIIFGTSNKGSVGRVDQALAESGTYISDVLDAKQIAQWGTVRMRAQAAGKANVTIATRSGNVKEPDEATWSSWSKEQRVDGGFLNIGSPAGRFLQYRLTLTRSDSDSPTVQQVRMIYQVGNLAPAIKVVTVKPSAKGAAGPPRPGGGAKHYRQVAIKATDTNGDKISFIIEFREMGDENWIEIAKDLTKPQFVWDTQTVGDGVYELRVEASDSPSNPPASALTAGRISDPVVVDNTSPAISDLRAKPAKDKVIVSGLATDAASRIVSMHYSVDSQEKWIVVAAADGISDADSEEFRFELTDLEAGAHRIAVKAADLYGNVGYGSVSITTGK